MTFRVVVPAWKSWEWISRRTYDFLVRGGIALRRVIVLVGDKDQLAMYKKHAPGPRYELTVPGLVASREFAQANLVEKGEPVLWVNDDVDDLLELGVDGALHSIKDLTGFVEEAFAEMHRHHATLWGVYAVANHYFMTRGKIRTDLRHIVGSLYGQLNPGSSQLHRIRFGEAKEDYERSLRAYAMDGAVVRYDGVAVKTTYYNHKKGDPIGGRFTARTVQEVEDGVRNLERAFPGQVRRSTRRKGPWPEITIGVPKALA